jgi:hypothetical protein
MNYKTENVFTHRLSQGNLTVELDRVWYDDGQTFPTYNLNIWTCNNDGLGFKTSIQNLYSNDLKALMEKLFLVTTKEAAFVDALIKEDNEKRKQK